VQFDKFLKHFTCFLSAMRMILNLHKSQKFALSFKQILKRWCKLLRQIQKNQLRYFDDLDQSHEAKTNGLVWYSFFSGSD